MRKSLFAFFSTASLITIVCLASALPTSAQCSGTYFRPDYRAVNKLPPMHFTTQWVLQDWTGDGRSDFWNFRRNQTTQTQDVVIFPALAAGYWDWDNPIVYTTPLPFLDDISTTGISGLNPYITIKDFDSDGRMDLWMRYGSQPIQRIYRNDGSGALVAQALIPNPPGFSITIDYSDLSGDGRLDWIIRGTVSGESAIQYSVANADGSFGPSTTILAHTPENGLSGAWAQAADFDGDGKLDISYQASNYIRLLRGLGGAAFSLGPSISIPSGSSTYTTDLNGDGRADLYGLSGSALRVLFGQSDGTFSAQVKTVTNFANATLAYPAADLNGDSRKDLIVIKDQDYEVHLTDPAGTFTSQLYPRSLRYNQFQHLHFEDFNADGKADLVDAVQRVYHLYNTFSEEVMVIKRNFCDQKGQTLAPNFDGSLQPDIVTWNGANGQWRSGNGNWNPGSTVPVTSFGWGSGALGDVPAPGDFDGDGRTDYTVYRNGEGNWYTYLSATSSWSVTRFGSPGDIPIPNDFDGGGKTDVAVFRPSDGNWYVWYTETQQFSVVHWGANGDRPVPADFDGDGKTDISVFRPTEGNWYYIRSSDAGYGIFHWGLNGDTPVPADYDGDAKADLSVFRSGVWHILRSSNGAYAPVSWGNATDVPIPYLSRGEVSIPVVYRPSDSHWYPFNFPLGYGLILGGTPVYFGLPNN